MMRILTSVVAVVFALGASAGELSVTNIEARQRYPWNGLVDIVVTFQGTAEDVATLECTFSATNISTQSAIPLSHLQRSGADAGSDAVWTRHYIWSAAADIGKVQIDDVALAVSVKAPGVQLWAGGPYWHECNLGATKPEEAGYYFWWGDTVGYKRVGTQWNAVDGSKTGFSFSSANCWTYGVSKTALASRGATDSNGFLVEKYDAVKAHLGAPWRLTRTWDYTAMMEKCTSTWTTRNGVYGRLVSGKDDYASNSIFFPAAGYASGTSLSWNGSDGFYWTSLPDPGLSGQAWYQEFDSSKFQRENDHYRYYGHPLRPIRLNQITFVADTAATHLSLDCKTGVQEVSADGKVLCYDAKWYANGIQVRITDNGEELETGVSGTKHWEPSYYGKHHLQMTVLNDSTNQIAALTADFVYISPTGSVVISNDRTELPAGMFEDCDWLTSVTIPESVTNIGERAFASCSGLTTLKIPSSVTGIGKNAFTGCTSLTSVTIPECVKSLEGTFPSAYSKLTNVILADGVTCIYDYAFEGCRMLPSVMIPASVTSIGNGAFWGCSGLVSLIIPASVTNIGENAFRECRGLASVRIPQNVMNIGWMAFADCSELTTIDVSEENAFYSSVDGVLFNKTKTALIACPKTFMTVTLPETVTSIGTGAFYDCDKLTMVAMPPSVTNISAYAFSGCSGLTSVTIPASVTSVRAYAFSGCSGLTSVTIPSSVASISSYAFSDCSGLTSVTIPASVTNIGNKAFYGCDELASVTIPKCVENLSETFPSAYSKLKNVIIDDGVTSIGPSAFAECCVTSVTIPPSVTNIGEYAFVCCSELTSVSIPSNVTCVGKYAFAECSGLTSATIPPSVTNIGYGAFSGCDELGGGVVMIDGCVLTVNGACPTDVVIPDGVRLIAGGAFANCSGLKSVVIPASVTSIGEKAFDGCSGLVSATIPSWVDDVTHLFPSSYENLSAITFAKGSTRVMCAHFADCSSLNSVTIPFGVTSIEAGAFADCGCLSLVSIPSSVTSIGEGAFANCSGLGEGAVIVDGCLLHLTGDCPSEFVVPTGVRLIADGVFRNRLNMWSVQLPNSLKVIGNCAFYNCHGLMSISIPSAVTSIGRDAFYGCGGLGDGVVIVDDCALCVNWDYPDDVVIPDGVRLIAGGAFAGCEGLTTVSIPASVTNIGRGAFAECPDLQAIIVPQEASQRMLALFRDSDCGVDEALVVAVDTTGMPVQDGLILTLGTTAEITNDIVSVGHNSVTSNLVYCLTAGDDEETWLEATVTNEVRVSFLWKCSCEGLFRDDPLPYDYFAFKVDGQRRTFICGEAEWTNVVLEITRTGEHVIKWVYHKDESDAEGQDCGWVTDICVDRKTWVRFASGEGVTGDLPIERIGYSGDLTELPNCELVRDGYLFDGWSDGTSIYQSGEAYVYPGGEVTMTAMWREDRLFEPEISLPESFDGETTEVTLSSRDDAEIYYTTELLSVEELDRWMLYTGPFSIARGAEIHAVARKSGCTDSRMAVARVVRYWTKGEYLEMPNTEVEDCGDIAWETTTGIDGTDGHALVSGVTGDGQNCGLSFRVSGEGTLTMRCRVSSEIRKRVVRDGLAVRVDGGAQLCWIGGDTGWTNVVVAVEGRTEHVITVCYEKDSAGSDGEDRAIIDWMRWDEGFDFDIDANGVLTAYNGEGGEVILPNSVTSIGSQAFANCKNLTKVTIPAGVTNVSEMAFGNCSGLVCVEIIGTAVEIDATAFTGVGSNARRCRLVLAEDWAGEVPHVNGVWHGGRFALPGSSLDTCRIVLTPQENTVVVVTANGVAIEPVEGVYTVALDAAITIDFVAASDYVLKGQTKWAFVTTQDVEFGVGDFAYPTVCQVNGSGTEDDPWLVGKDDDDVRAYVRGGCLVFVGEGKVAGTPWMDQSADIRRVEIGQGVTELPEGVFKGLTIGTVNGMSVDVFNNLAAGGVRADVTGLSINSQSASAVLVLEVQKTESLEMPEWRTLEQLNVSVPATGTTGFFRILAHP